MPEMKPPERIIGKKEKTPWKGSKRPLPLSQFKELLLQIMDQKDHWAWQYFSGGQITKTQLKVHYQQEYEVYVRDFPVFLSRIHAKSPPLGVRRDLASNLYEEETGGLSVGRSHPELFLIMMEGLGYSVSDFSSVKLLSGSRRYRRWLDRITETAHWVIAASVITIFVEGSCKDRKDTDPSEKCKPLDLAQKITEHPLVRFHGLDPSCLGLVRAHHEVEGGHRLAAWKMVLDYAQTAKIQKDIYDAVFKSLQLWLSYRDEIALDCGLKQ